MIARRAILLRLAAAVVPIRIPSECLMGEKISEKSVGIYFEENSRQTRSIAV
jgi:hypothetical protein